jgi:hypothetical protein
LSGYAQTAGEVRQKNCRIWGKLIEDENEENNENEDENEDEDEDEDEDECEVRQKRGVRATYAKEWGWGTPRKKPYVARTILT